MNSLKDSSKSGINWLGLDDELAMNYLEKVMEKHSSPCMENEMAKQGEQKQLEDLPPKPQNQQSSSNQEKPEKDPGIINVVPKEMLKNNVSQELQPVQNDAPSPVGLPHLRAESKNTNLIINYLPPNMVTCELFAIFSKFGSIYECKVIGDPTSGKSCGYAFVNYFTAMSASMAVQMGNGMQVRGKRLKVSYARPQCESIKNTNVYVSHLPKDIDEKRLGEIFGCYGKIIEMNLLRYPNNGQPRGIAFVRFDLNSSARMACNALNKYVLAENQQPIEVKLVNRHSRNQGAQGAPSYPNFEQNFAPIGYYSQPSYAMPPMPPMPPPAPAFYQKANEPPYTRREYNNKDYFIPKRPRLI